jgi:hypothetical protein
MVNSGIIPVAAFHQLIYGEQFVVPGQRTQDSLASRGKFEPIGLELFD